MYPVSPRWPRALTTSHGAETRVDVLLEGVPVREDLPIVDGSVSVDGGSAVRRSLSLTIADPDDFPRADDSVLAPFGHRLRVQRGIRYLDGSVEWVPVGFFVVETVEGDVHSGPLTITAPGLESLIQAAPFEQAVSTRPYAHARAFVEAQLQAVDPSILLVDESEHGTDSLATVVYDPGADRWQAIQDVAASVGCEVFADAQGSFVMRDVPTMGDIDWDVSAGANGVLVSAARSVSADGVYNRVTVHGENTADDAPPVSGTATITDPTDPLRYDGPYGRRVLVTTSDYATTANRALIAANAELRRRRGSNRTVSLSAVPNAALDVGDTIRVGYLGQPPELHVVWSFSIPLGDGGGAFDIETIGGQDAD